MGPTAIPPVSKLLFVFRDLATLHSSAADERKRSNLWSAPVSWFLSPIKLLKVNLSLMSIPLVLCTRIGSLKAISLVTQQPTASRVWLLIVCWLLVFPREITALLSHECVYSPDLETLVITDDCMEKVWFEMKFHLCIYPDTVGTINIVTIHMDEKSETHSSIGESVQKSDSSSLHFYQQEQELFAVVTLGSRWHQCWIP